MPAGVFFVIALFTSSGNSMALANPAEVSPLASKEEMIRDRFQRFQDRVFRLREQLSQAEPENAARLGRALSRSGELALSEKLDEIILRLKEGAALDQAADAQAAWIEEADRLLGILLEQDGSNDERKKELDRLQKYQEKLNQLLSQQKGLRSDSAQSTESQRLAQQLDQAIRRAEALIQKQQQLSKQAASAPSSEQQTSLSRETEQLAEDIKKLAESPSSESAPKSAVESAKQQTQSAAQSAQSAASKMSEAGRQMSQGGSPSSPQQQAEEALQEAKKQLEDAKKSLEQQQKPTAQQSGEQKQVAQQTKGLSDQMKQDAAGGKSGEPGEQGENGGKPGGKSGQSGQSGKKQKKTPGAENLDQAEQDMDGAAESLDQKKPQEATPKQDDAVAQLEQAQNELEQAIEQLRKEQREETLRDLEARFRDMLAKQRPINEATITLGTQGKDSFQRAEELQLAELSASQKTLADAAATCLHILDEEGSTIAFPHIVEQLSEDMTASAERLAGLDVGTVTQAIQQEILDTLEQLIDAVKKMQQENEQQQGQQGQQADKEKPLLPESAELKLLRSSQLRVNTRTTAIHEGAAKGTESPDVAARGLKKLAARQVECAEIAKQMREKEMGQ